MRLRTYSVASRLQSNRRLRLGLLPARLRLVAFHPCPSIAMRRQSFGS
jgi:hypothetical protein